MALIFLKKGYFWPTFHNSKSPGKRHKNAFSTYLIYIHTRILLTPLTFFFLHGPIMQKLRIYHVWFLFGATPGVLILIRAILEQSLNDKMVSKI